jgi:MerR family transcriptional regulator, light-induced transcriptional regulator
MHLAFSASPVSRMLKLGRAFSSWTLSSMFERHTSDPSRSRDGDGSTDDECRRSMRTVLESQIIPRLVQAHRVGEERVGEERAANDSASRALLEEIIAFAGFCARGERQNAALLIERLQTEGLDQEGIFIELITPAARYLGEQWEEDQLGFADVTVGLMLMQEVIHGMGFEYHDGPQHATCVKRVMLASAPGSQHVLGLSIVSEMFRKAGWQVVLEVSPSRTQLCHAVQNEWFDLVGLSVALDSQLDTLSSLVDSLKAASRNPATPVLLGGQAFSMGGHRAEAFGAQAICVDARECVPMALAALAP